MCKSEWVNNAWGCGECVKNEDGRIFFVCFGGNGGRWKIFFFYFNFFIFFLIFLFIVAHCFAHAATLAGTNGGRRLHAGRSLVRTGCYALAAAQQLLPPPRDAAPAGPHMHTLLYLKLFTILQNPRSCCGFVPTTPGFGTPRLSLSGPPPPISGSLSAPPQS